MRVVIQRVRQASVTVDGSVVGEIGLGFLCLVGVTHDDGPEEVEALAEKVAGLRVFPDGDGRMNRSIVDAGGSVLAVSQFTLYGDVRRGRRPSFTEAADPAVAAPIVDDFVEALSRRGVPVETGRFGAMMDVELLNDGPVTLVVEAVRGRVV